MRRLTAAVFAVLLVFLFGCTKNSDTQNVPQPDEPTAQTSKNAPEQKDDAPGGELAVSGEDFLSAQYVRQMPGNATSIVGDERGELILLSTKKELSNLWISRVEFDEQQKDYIRSDRIWWMKKWEPGDDLVLSMALTKQYPTMELSWEDEFHQRERRLIEFTRVFNGTQVSETARLLYFVAPLKATDLTDCGRYYYDVNADGSKEILRFTKPDQTAGEDPMASLKITLGKTVYEHHFSLCDRCRCFLADLDGDYRAEIYVSGSDAQNRAYTYALQLSDLGIESMPIAEEAALHDADENAVLSGSIEKAEDRVLYLLDTVYVFGEKYTAHIPYAYHDGQLEAIDGVWKLDAGNTVRTNFAVLAEQEDGTQITLPAGTQLLPMSTDRKSYVNAKTQTGEQVSISISLTKDGDWEIGGYTVEELF